MQRTWPGDTIDFVFGGAPQWDVSPYVASWSDPDSTLRATLGRVLDYVQSHLDVHFSVTGATAHGITFHNGVPKDGSIDGITVHDTGTVATRADSFVQAYESYNFGLVLHELGHGLGLDHETFTTDPALSIMSAAYSSADLAKVQAFGQDDLAALNGIFGSSASYTGDWKGTPWADKLYGGTGDYDPSDGSEKIEGLQGNDTLFGCGGNDVIYGNQDADLLYGGAGNDTLFGGAGDDTIHGGAGTNVLYGNNGTDTFYIHAGDIVADFQPGIDHIIMEG